LGAKRIAANMATEGRRTNEGAMLKTDGSRPRAPHGNASMLAIALCGLICIATAPTARLSHAQLDPRVGSGGQPLLGAQKQIISNNWSGYMLAGGPYTSIQGTWIVPAVAYVPYPESPAEEVTSSWIGIGGEAKDKPLIQLGIQQRVTSTGAVAYSAWYELLPANEQPLGADFPVSPGDTITASIQCTALCTPNTDSTTWVLTMNNGGRWQHPFRQQFIYRSTLASAEWIMEATCLNDCTSTPQDYSFLPSFGPVVFSGLAANGGNPNLTQQSSVVLNDPNGGATSTPSAPVGGNSFSVAFAGPNAPPPPPTASGYTFDSFDINDAFNTRLLGINDAGRYVGYYGSSDATTAFSLNADGTITTTRVIGAPYTYLYGINSGGTMVGYYGNAQAGYINGFTIKDGSTAVIPIVVPSARATFAYGINSRGQIVGQYQDSGARRHAFLLDGTTVLTIDPPGATGDAAAWGINDSGQIVGAYVEGNGTRGFLRNADGSFIPIGPDGATSSGAYGINNAGVIVGSYNTPAGSHGFVYSAGSYKIVDVPSSLGTLFSLTGINASGQLAGTLAAVVDGWSRTYGFIATPAGTPFVSAGPVSHLRAGPVMMLSR
jgi:probable HAF family extracellular repeat protein